MNYLVLRVNLKFSHIICIVSALMFNHSSNASENKGEKSAGQAEYEIACMSCHGLDGKGDGPQAKRLSVMPADLTRLARSRNGQFPDREIYDLIDGRGVIPAHGKRDMPIWGARYRAGDNQKNDPIQNESRARQQIENLVSYLKQIQEK